MKKTILCMVLIPVLAFAACGKAPSAEVTAAPSAETSAAPTETKPAESAPAAPSEIPTVAEEPAETEEPGAIINVYVSDEMAEHFVILQESADVVDENTVFDALKSAGTIPQEATLLSFSNDGGALTLDMSAEFADRVRTMGTSGEYMLLGSVVNTYLTAFDAQTVTLLSNGNPLETGHNVYSEPMGFFEDNAA